MACWENQSRSTNTQMLHIEDNSKPHDIRVTCFGAMAHSPWASLDGCSLSSKVEEQHNGAFIVTTSTKTTEKEAVTQPAKLLYSQSDTNITHGIIWGGGHDGRGRRLQKMQTFPKRKWPCTKTGHAVVGWNTLTGKQNRQVKWLTVWLSRSADRLEKLDKCYDPARRSGSILVFWNPSLGFIRIPNANDGNGTSGNSTCSV